ncbi:MAG: hypothetical protein WCJ56_06490 [bacterium]
MLIDGYTLFGSWPGLPYDHPVEHLLAGMKQHKIDRACTLSSQGIFFDAAVGNATTYAACQADARLIPIGVVDPRLNGVEQVVFCQQHGFRMLSMFPFAQNWSVDSICATQLLKAIADSKLPVMIEAYSDGDASQIWRAMGDQDIPLILLDANPNTLTETITLIQARPHTYLATRLLCGGDTIELLVDRVGADKLVFTSRFPISCFSSAFLTAKFAAISDQDRAAILGENISGLLGIA